jgi:E3 Ubiquitin ligase
MLHGWRTHSAGLLTSFADLALLAMGAHSDSPTGWLISSSLIAALSFVAWAANLKRYRLIGDIPTSRAASAAQGYVELQGRAEPDPGLPVVSKLTSLPCVWYRYRVERETSDNKWELVDSGESDSPFLLVDASGNCAIDPDQAEVMTTRKATWTREGYRYTEHLLLSKDNLYALGEFATLGGASAELDFKSDLNALLSEWKRDQPRLLERFDLNQDRELDAAEWERARIEARREVIENHREAHADSGFSVLRKPRDGKLFLLTNLSAEALTRKYRLWGAVHLTLFFTAGAAALYLANA